jgi:hypothetical protein
MDADGDFVVAWRSDGQDGATGGIFAQRFGDGIVPFAAIDVDADADALTDGLLILRYLFGFRGAVLITGAIDTINCSRCSAQAIEGYIAGLL